MMIDRRALLLDVWSLPWVGITSRFIGSIWLTGGKWQRNTRSDLYHCNNSDMMVSNINTRGS